MWYLLDNQHPITNITLIAVL